MERFSSDLMQAVRNMAGCGSVWNSWSKVKIDLKEGKDRFKVKIVHFNVKVSHMW